MTKTWLITGTSTGFGKSLSIYLAQQADVNLVATARHTDQLSYLDQYDHGQILKQTLDVTKADEIAAAVKATTEKFGTLDVLINNAGLGYFGTFEESDRDAVRYMFDVNVWGLVDMTRAVLPTMRAQKSGIVINFSSIAGLASFPTLSFYNGTKHAVEGITDAMAQEVADQGIKLMLIEPSGFRTDWAGRSSQKAMPTIDAYKQFTANIEGSASDAHHEAGDPDKAAAIIYDQVTNHAADLPLHLPLGKFASDTAIAKYEKSLGEFKAERDLSISADQPE
ncbi:oxidoreductase, short chain dehydrogenase reductase family protein [Levilactobacillus paucivorans]|uniref:Oxidoreductase, short chain dehydrogenase reductase family protein n=1 Tax=Levilactobacillus paucivorans TaxID=616990 RepID=A0A0R2LTF1_9LACO|nr:MULTISPECIES: SDR family NAD(P)-dependent oxidoreductase [Levilactobacillus]KRO04879.1 oxidoreductase, short chain dehydrogenase reductase family protein [Levilactobacillus paucivorans]